MTVTQLAKQVEVLTGMVSALSQRMGESESGTEAQRSNAWVDQIRGTFEDNAAYRQAAEAGRKWRETQAGADGAKPQASRHVPTRRRKRASTGK